VCEGKSVGCWPRYRRRLGPAERFGVGIGGLDVSLDGFFELGDRAKHASFQGTLGQQREEAFDLIDP